MSIGKIGIFLNSLPPNEWFVCNHCTQHYTPSRHLFESYTPCTDGTYIENMMGRKMTVQGFGTVSINGFKLSEVYHVPDCKANYLSAKSNLLIDFSCKENEFPIFSKDKQVMKAVRKYGIWIVTNFSHKLNVVGLIGFTPNILLPSYQWLMSSASTNHCTPNRDVLEKFLPTNLKMKNMKYVELLNDCKCPVLGLGSFNLNGIKLNNVFYVPDIKINIISVRQLCENGYEISFVENSAIVKAQDGSVVMTAVKQSGGYVIDDCDLNRDDLFSKGSSVSDYHFQSHHWIVCISAPKHHCAIKELFEDEPKLTNKPAVKSHANGLNFNTEGTGTIQLTENLTLKNVRYCSTLSTNVISVNELKEDGFDINFNSQSLTISKNGQEVLKAFLKDGLYVAKIFESKIVATSDSNLHGESTNALTMSTVQTLDTLTKFENEISMTLHPNETSKNDLINDAGDKTDFSDGKCVGKIFLDNLDKLKSNEWMVCENSSCHVTIHPDLYQEMELLPNESYVQIGNSNLKYRVVAVGKIKFPNFELCQVYHCPVLSANLISMGIFAMYNDLEIITTDDELVVQKDGITLHCERKKLGFWIITGPELEPDNLQNRSGFNEQHDSCLANSQSDNPDPTTAINFYDDEDHIVVVRKFIEDRNISSRDQTVSESMSRSNGGSSIDISQVEQTTNKYDTFYQPEPQQMSDALSNSDTSNDTYLPFAHTETKNTQVQYDELSDTSKERYQNSKKHGDDQIELKMPCLSSKVDDPIERSFCENRAFASLNGQEVFEYTFKSNVYYVEDTVAQELNSCLLEGELIGSIDNPDWLTFNNRFSGTVGSFLPELGPDEWQVSHTSSCHVTNNVEHFVAFQPYIYPQFLIVGDKKYSILVAGIVNVNGIELNPCFYVPELNANIISIGALVSFLNCQVKLDNSGLTIICNETPLYTEPKKHGIWIITQDPFIGSNGDSNYSYPNGENEISKTMVNEKNSYAQSDNWSISASLPKNFTDSQSEAWTNNSSVYEKPVDSQLCDLARNSPAYQPVDSKPEDWTNTPPGYDKQAYSQPEILARNSSTYEPVYSKSEDWVNNPPVYDKPFDSQPDTLDRNPVYEPVYSKPEDWSNNPPVYDKPVDSQPETLTHNFTYESVYSKPEDWSNNPPVYDKPVDSQPETLTHNAYEPVYSKSEDWTSAPQVYYKPVDSQPETLTNIPPVYGKPLQSQPETWANNSPAYEPAHSKPENWTNPPPSYDKSDQSQPEYFHCNSSTCEPVYSKSEDWTNNPPVYDKPIDSQTETLARNSPAYQPVDSKSEDWTNTQPCYDKQAYSQPETLAHNSSTYEPVYSKSEDWTNAPPSYDKQVLSHSETLAPCSSVYEPVHSKPEDWTNAPPSAQSQPESFYCNSSTIESVHSKSEDWTNNRPVYQKPVYSRSQAINLTASAKPETLPRNSSAYEPVHSKPEDWTNAPQVCHKPVDSHPETLARNSSTYKPVESKTGDWTNIPPVYGKPVQSQPETWARNSSTYEQVQSKPEDWTSSPTVCNLNVDEKQDAYKPIYSKPDGAMRNDTPLTTSNKDIITSENQSISSKLNTSLPLKSTNPQSDLDDEVIGNVETLNASLGVKDWQIDPTATGHFARDYEVFDEFSQIKETKYVLVNGIKYRVKAKGKASIGEWQLTEVYLVPNLPTNCISIDRLNLTGYTLKFSTTKDHVSIMKQGKVLASTFCRPDGSYVITAPSSPDKFANKR